MRKIVLMLVLALVGLGAVFETVRACHRRFWRFAPCQAVCAVENPTNAPIDPADFAEYGQDLKKPSDVPSPPGVPSLEELKKKMTQAPAPATIMVRVPGNAELYFWDKRSQQSGALRNFTTPTLEPGSDYWYEVTAKITVNGRTITKQRNLTVRAAQRTR